jgi:ribosomal protein S18 acetylase RimI-like enzyme
MNFRIRIAGNDDAAAIARVQVESWKTTYADIVPGAFLASMSVDAAAVRWREQFAGSASTVLVAEDESSIFGFIGGGKLRKPIADYDGEIYAIYLMQDRQRRGVGRALTTALANALRSEGLASMIVWVLRENPAVGFYRRLGAVPIAEANIEIGGAMLEELALGWLSLDAFLDGSKDLTGAA